MRLAIDEHMQHKDVYTHSLVGARAGDRPGDRRSGPRAAARGAAARHRQARDPAHGTRRPGQLPPPRGRRREADAAAAARAALPEGRDRRGVAAGVPAPALPRLRHRRVDRLGGAPLRRRRGTAAGPAARTGALRLHHAQPAPAPRRCSAATTRSSSGSRSCARRRSSTRSARTSTATRSCSCSASLRARWSARPTSTCSRCGWSAGRWTPTRRRRSCGGGRPRTGSGSPGLAQSAGFRVQTGA